MSFHGSSARMDGRTEGQRIERDPTMDNHIVHAVSVSNKKEQSQLRSKERSLQNEFKVEQHIIRREEKSLLKQFHKLQLEKYHRHQELHSPRGSERRLLSTYGGGTHRSGHSINRLDSPGSSGHGLHTPRVSRDHVAGRTDRTTMPSHSSMRLTRQYPSSSMISSNYAPSYVSSTLSAHRGAAGGPGIPMIDSHPHVPQDHKRHGHDGTTDDGVGAHHHHQPPHPHHQRHHVHARDEIEDLVDSYMAPHQPAGYGHSIKGEHRGAHSHRAHRDKHSHRHHSVDFDSPGNYRNIGILHRLNDIGPDSYSYPRLTRRKEDTGSDTGAHGKPLPRNALIDHERRLLRGGHERVDGPRASEGPGAHGKGTSSHGSLASQGRHVAPNETSAPPLPPGNQTSERPEADNLEITIRINRKKGEEQDRIDVTKIPISKSLEDKRSREGGSLHKVVKSKSSMAGNSKHKGKEPLKGHGHHHSGTSVRTVDHHHSPAVASLQQRSQEEGEAEMLAELKAMCGNATQGYFTGHGGGFGNRRTRFKQLVKELVMKQMPAMARKRQLAEFDPLEALQCRYLRLSPTNIEDLLRMCKESGVEIDIHPHSEIADITQHIFPKETDDGAAHSG